MRASHKLNLHLKKGGRAVPAICAAIRTAQFALPTPAIAVRGLHIFRRDYPNGVGRVRPIH